MSFMLRSGIQLRAPFLTGNAQTPDLSLDALMPRTKDGHLSFPGTQVKGILRDSLHSMLAMSETGLCGLPKETTEKLLVKFFGRSSRDLDDETVISQGGAFDAFAPRTQLAHFSDLVSCDAFPPEKSTTKTRIARNELTGTPKEGQFQRSELIAPHGTLVWFVMSVELPGWNEEDAQFAQKLFDIAFAPITAIGANKTAGFGRVVCVEPCMLEKCKATALLKSFDRVTPAAGGLHSIRASLVPQGPLLIDADRRASNAFTSSSTVPGGALKAALAEGLALNDANNPDIEGFLTALSISHAFPRLNKEKVRQVVLPLSLAAYFVDSGTVVTDALTYNGAPILFDNSRLVAPKFETDWKRSQIKCVRSAVQKHLAAKEWSCIEPSLLSEFKVRTAIDAQTGSAETSDGAGLLFSYEAVLPLAEGTKTEDVVWDFTLSSADAAKLAEFAECGISSPIRLGKLKTAIEIHAAQPCKKNPVGPLSETAESKVYTITLQSPAAIFEMVEIREKNLQQLYAEYFELLFTGKISQDGKGAVRLSNFFAEQELRGGYQAQRFHGGRDIYAPWVLTKPGSTFSFSVDPAFGSAFEETLTKLQDTGLPVSSQVAKRDWRHCPFVPENGYGAFLVNMLPYRWCSSNAARILCVSEREGIAC